MASSAGFNHIYVTVHISILFESTCSTTSLLLFLIDWILTVHTLICPLLGLSSTVLSWVIWIDDKCWGVPRHVEHVSGSLLLSIITRTVLSEGSTMSSMVTSSDLIQEAPHHSEYVGDFLWFVIISGILLQWPFTQLDYIHYRKSFSSAVSNSNVKVISSKECIKHMVCIPMPRVMCG